MQALPPLTAAAAGVMAYALTRFLVLPAAGHRLARLAAGDGSPRGPRTGAWWPDAVRRLLPESRARLLARAWPAGREIEEALAGSGYRPLDVRLAGIAAGLALVLVLGLAGLGSRGLSPGWLFGLGLGLALAGPGLVLKAAADKRRVAIDVELPKAAELLTLGTESGLGLLEAARMAAALCPGPAGEALGAALTEVDSGRETAAALRDAAERLGTPDATAFFGAIVQGLALGAPVARVLRSQADSLRAKRRQALETAVAGLSVKLTVVTIVLFVPALFVLAVLPNVLAFLGGRW